MRGRHLIADVRNILNIDIIKTVDGVKPLMKKKNEMNLNVKGEINHQFQPFGATLYLLAGSHLSIHSYVEGKYVAIDLYCCSTSINMNKVLEIIYNYFDCNCIIKKNIIDRY